MVKNQPTIVNKMEDLRCDICGGSLKNCKGEYLAGLTRPVDAANPNGPHKYFKAIHISCYVEEKK